MPRSTLGEKAGEDRARADGTGLCEPYGGDPGGTQAAVVPTSPADSLRPEPKPAIDDQEPVPVPDQLAGHRSSSAAKFGRPPSSRKPPWASAFLAVFAFVEPIFN